MQLGIIVNIIRRILKYPFAKVHAFILKWKIDVIAGCNVFHVL